jgi:hypothetical protein
MVPLPLLHIFVFMRIGGVSGQNIGKKGVIRKIFKIMELRESFTSGEPSSGRLNGAEVTIRAS